MLNPEVASERLKQFKVADGEQRRLADVAMLPEPHRRIAYAMLDRDAAGQSITNQRYGSEQTAARRQFDALSDEERRNIFNALFPLLAADVERGWRLMANVPYQTSYYHKAFRAPHSPEQVHARRMEWIRQLLNFTEDYPYDLTWYATWAAYMGYYGGAIGYLFAAAIVSRDAAGDAIFDLLLASARGEHEVAAMGRHVTLALLVADRPDGWTYIEQLLLAAQRQEGLRQTILETVDEAHPEAFRRMLRLLLDQDLVRFSSVTRAVDVWTGFQLDALTPKAVRGVIEQLSAFLDDSAACCAALRATDPQAIYLALWALAFHDVADATEAAAPLLQGGTEETRFAAAALLRQLETRPARMTLLAALDDSNLHVAYEAVQALANCGAMFTDTDCFERLERLVARLPAREVTLPPLVWPWTGTTLSRETVAGNLLHCLGSRPIQRLTPYLAVMDSSGRASVVRHLTKADSPTEPAPATREILYTLVADPVAWVSEDAMKAVGQFRSTEQEAIRVEGLLTRKTPALRSAMIRLLLSQTDERALASVERLLNAGKPEQRLAGLEIYRELQTTSRVPGAVPIVLKQYRDSPRKKTDAEARMLEELLRPEEALTNDNGLGLFDPAVLTPRVTPVMPQQTTFITEAAVRCLESLILLLADHRATPVIVETHDGKKEVLLGDLTYMFPRTRSNVPLDEDIAHLPLRAVWETWLQERPAALRDPDGNELLRAHAAQIWLQYRPDQPQSHRAHWAHDWFQAAARQLYWHERLDSLPKQRPAQVTALLDWLLRISAPVAADFLLNAATTSVAVVPRAEVERLVDDKDYRDRDWRDDDILNGWLNVARQQHRHLPEVWKPEQEVRLWQLLHWRDRPIATFSRRKPSMWETMVAYAAGGANEADILDMLVGPPDGGHSGGGFRDLHAVSSRKPDTLRERYPILTDLVTRCRNRIIDIETRRGDLATPASKPATELRYTGDLDTLGRVLPACTTDAFDRNRWSSDQSKMAVLSHLIRHTVPGESDTPQAFADVMNALRCTPQRMVELAVMAPQWTDHVEHTLGWTGLAEGVWWLHAHTKDDQWGVEQELKDHWAAQVAERTPLSTASLLEGAVDVAWFHRVNAALGPERWSLVSDAARYASSGTGHARARLYADAMLNRVSLDELMARVKQKRNKDALCAIGLLPLAPSATHATDLLERYEVIQEFLRSSKKFGSQRQASEKLAASIAMQNLARNAGFADPARLQWAMETAAIADLAAGPVTATAGDVAITLAIDGLGQPDLTFTRAGKPLKTLPPAARKDEQVSALLDRKQEIAGQAVRMRLSLAEAMCRGDQFTGAELQDLLRHPVLAPMLRSLVFIGSGLAGYPIQSGSALENHAGDRLPIAPNVLLQVAHPHDLMKTQEWHLWQRDCFLRERVQPFKQVFRELYVLTAAEITEGYDSRRYEGHQVNPKQALALLGKCGWVSRPEEGVFRTFHAENLTAWLTFDQGFTTPAEVEGLTIEGLWFTRKGQSKALPLEEIPPRVFSEVMRDVDLVVSVAHVGGVDPEASRSTVEMREALLRETAGMLKITNIRYQGQHAFIDGELGTYSLHLGSAVVHRQPGGHLCIVPVHSQHRGRVFLPFVDDDPKTAEVISKALLLAKDKEIKDPTILEQILRA